jgi:hypothetical protein
VRSPPSPPSSGVDRTAAVVGLAYGPVVATAVDIGGMTGDIEDLEPVLIAMAADLLYRHLAHTSEGSTTDG